MFFATGHACSFNKLQFSAAFVARNQFEFFSAGFFLFINTFGWEILGYLVTYVLLRPQHHQLWRYAILFQLLELCCACVAASILRRHLMVWAIFAPRFVFSAILSTILISLVVGFKIFQITWLMYMINQALSNHVLCNSNMITIVSQCKNKNAILLNTAYSVTKPRSNSHGGHKYSELN